MKFSLFTLLVVVTLICIGLGINSLLTPAPIQFSAWKLMETENGKIARYRVWVLARPRPKQYTDDQQTYNAVDFSIKQYRGVEVVTPDYIYSCWFNLNTPVFSNEDHFIEKFPIVTPNPIKVVDREK